MLASAIDLAILRAAAPTTFGMGLFRYSSAFNTGSSSTSSSSTFSSSSLSCSSLTESEVSFSLVSGSSVPM
jgi:hypothetical protein